MIGGITVLHFVSTCNKKRKWGSMVDLKKGKCGDWGFIANGFI